MIRIIVILLFSMTYVWADGKELKSEMPYTEHSFDTLVDGEKLEVDPDRLGTFLQGLSDSQIAVISVQGMVCDFCARGIEKMFKLDPKVKKIDVDLSKGKVLVAYSDEDSIDFKDLHS